MQQENERKESVKELNEIKQVHKGRYPRKVAQKAKALKIKTRSGIPVVPTRMDLFLDAYFKNDGNATAAAMEVFNCKSRAVAASMGSAYLHRAKEIGRLIMEEKGATFPRMIQMALLQMQNPKSDGTFVALWDRLMKLGGYQDFMPERKGEGVGPTVNIVNVHKNNMSKYVDGSFDDVIEGEEVSIDGE